jgi:rieske iron-sulfur protein
MHRDKLDDEVRRRLLRGALCASLCAGGLRGAEAAADDPAKQAPQIGDELAFASYENDGRAITPTDLVAGEPPLIVYPRDPASGIIRERSRINQVLVLRLAPDEIAGLEVVDGGVIAFSGICTHAACGVTEWNATARHFVCPCHASEYDPRQKAKVVAGPAPRALPLLPIARRGEGYVVAGPFSGIVGAPT